VSREAEENQKSGEEGGCESEYVRDPENE